LSRRFTVRQIDIGCRLVDIEARARTARVCLSLAESMQKIQQCEDRCFQGALWRITENLHSRCDGALALLHTIRK